MLYEHLGLGSFETADNVLIASALWGFVRPGDRIPAYRLSMGATLPRIASLPALWRDPLRKALPDEGLIVDMRSGAYTAAWKPKQATVVGVRAFQDGKTISHMVKATRGDVARILLKGDPVETPEDVASAVRAAGHTVELSGSGRSWTSMCSATVPMTGVSDRDGTTRAETSYDVPRPLSARTSDGRSPPPWRVSAFKAPLRGRPSADPCPRAARGSAGGGAGRRWSTPRSRTGRPARARSR